MNQWCPFSCQFMKGILTFTKGQAQEPGETCLQLFALPLCGWITSGTLHDPTAYRLLRGSNTPTSHSRKLKFSEIFFKRIKLIILALKATRDLTWKVPRNSSRWLNGSSCCYVSKFLILQVFINSALSVKCEYLDLAMPGPIWFHVYISIPLRERVRDISWVERWRSNKRMCDHRSCKFS